MTLTGSTDNETWKKGRSRDSPESWGLNTVGWGERQASDNYYRRYNTYNQPYSIRTDRTKDDVGIWEMLMQYDLRHYMMGAVIQKTPGGQLEEID